MDWAIGARLPPHGSELRAAGATGGALAAFLLCLGSPRARNGRPEPSWEESPVGPDGSGLLGVEGAGSGPLDRLGA